MLRRRIAERKRRARLNTKDSEENGDEWIIDDDFETEDTSEPAPEASDIKMWSEADKAIYEEQLEHLHTQLTEALVQNQDLKIQLKDANRRVESAVAQKSSKKASSAYGHYHGSDLTVSTTAEGFESVTSVPTVQRDSKAIRLIDRFKNWFFGVLYDFTEESYDEDTEQEEPPLQAKKLKGNLQRLGASSKPYRDFGEFMLGVVQWKTPSLSLVVFLLYMYCVWNGWIIQLVLLFAIGYLCLNYLRVIGIVEQFGFEGKKRKTNEDNDMFGSLGLVDKFQLVKEVGQVAQNTSEKVADGLEKGQNLLLWYYPQATRKVFSVLCAGFVFSLFLPNSWTLTIMGLGIGYKLFIIDNVYRKYPKVKDKYDGVAKMWHSLPTNSQLEKRQRMTEEDLSVSNLTTLAAATPTFSIADTLFTDRFQLLPTELPLDGWQSGRRCTLLDKERPLVNSKSGRLFLTHGFLCFERSPQINDTIDRVAIPLKEITSLAKAKPFAVLPGSGMSLQLTLKRSPKPVIFGAILHRDQAHESLCDQAMILGLDWGSNPEGRGIDHTPSSLEPPTEQQDVTQ